MKTPAALYLEAGQPMVIDDIDLPDPGPRHVLVRQHATGVCHSQLHELDRPNAAVPLVLGHEAAGVVTAAGRDVPHVREGDHVLVTWVPRSAAPGMQLAPPPAASYRGTPVNVGAPTPTGVFTWAESIVADEQFVVPVDASVATDVTAVIGCAVMTGCGAAINAAQVRPNDPVAIIGAGGVGLSIIQACANVGAYPIVAVDLTADKLAFARRFGATHGVLASEGDPVAEVAALTGGGAAYAFDAIGIGATIEQALLMTRPRRVGEREGGTAVLVGVPHGEAPSISAFHIFRGNVYRGAPGGCSVPDRDFPLFVRWMQEGKLPLDQMVTQRYRLEEINEACAALRNGEIAGRAIVEFGG